MANYVAKARSNFFKVKDEEAFREWAESRELAVWEEEEKGEKWYCIYVGTELQEGWPTEVYYEYEDEYEDAEVEDADDADAEVEDEEVEDEDAEVEDAEVEYEEVEYFDVSEEICEHLQDGCVAVLMEVGHMSLQQLTGRAIAVNNKGERVEINIHDIYRKAKHLGTVINAVDVVW